MEIRAFSYNIHKGFGAMGVGFTLSSIREAVELSGADVLFLQEVQDRNEKHANRRLEWPAGGQMEFLASSLWEHHAYGPNVLYEHGHHGNAILSRVPMVRWENIDLSTYFFDQRGCLHGVVSQPGSSLEVHLLCVHLGLLETSRQKQVELIVNRIKKSVPESAPLILAGDFNDFSGRVSHKLREGLGLCEAFEEAQGASAKTFPSWGPVLRLDRIYFRGLKLKRVQRFEGKPWRTISDHLPLLAHFEA